MDAKRPIFVSALILLIAVVACGTDDGSGPSSAPDATLLAYAAQRDGEWAINTDYTSTGVSSQLVDVLGQEVPIAWSPDGSRLLFENMDPDYAFGLYVVDSDGSSLQNIEQTPGNNVGIHGPQWSRDGRYIAYSRSEDFWDGGPVELRVIDASSGQQVWAQPAHGHYVWHPTRDQLIFEVEETDPAHRDEYRLKKLDLPSTHVSDLDPEFNYEEWGSRIAPIPSPPGVDGLYWVNVRTYSQSGSWLWRSDFDARNFEQIVQVSSAWASADYQFCLGLSLIGGSGHCYPVWSHDRSRLAMRIVEGERDNTSSHLLLVEVEHPSSSIRIDQDTVGENSKEDHVISSIAFLPGSESFVYPLPAELGEETPRVLRRLDLNSMQSSMYSDQFEDIGPVICCGK